MFTENETFIIGFSVAKNNFALSVEKYTLDLFREEIEKKGYETTQQLIKVKWNENVDYSLLKKLIDFNIEDKKGMKSFFRK